MFRWAKATDEMICHGGHEPIAKGAAVTYVEDMNERLRSEVHGRPYCGYDHVRTHAMQRGLDFERTLKEPGLNPTQLESARKARRAWRDLEEAASRAEFGRTRGTR